MKRIVATLFVGLLCTGLAEFALPVGDYLNIATALAVGLIVGIYSEGVNSAESGIWGMGAGVVAGALTYLYLHVLQPLQSSLSLPTWTTALAVGAIAAGVVYGAISIIDIPASQKPERRPE